MSAAGDNENMTKTGPLLLYGFIVVKGKKE